jgi:hypothetical protein
MPQKRRRQPWGISVNFRPCVTHCNVACAHCDLRIPLIPSTARRPNDHQHSATNVPAFFTSDHICGEPLPLLHLVTEAARFDHKPVSFRENFLGIPNYPHSEKPYLSEWKRLLLNGKLKKPATGLTPPGLATAAALALKLTGSDKGIR